ncbi:hypothetical protein FJ934_09600 [Mesorhizobium sp. B2-4-12]|uniref:hypothetical protein n=1 Tax=Mesorhizobium sp. B2-4-12 TaxID=2589937 RepID=UPI00112769C8|nr:hypothetical protein [Mesorhizobium sp. B2-4-12]TPK96391.1 hypothetical protein FJ934_09600 [Mesorhizobium sp. B2-4-12]
MLNAITMQQLFVIAFVGRQGSSFLQGLLNSHPDATCLGELFSPSASRRGIKAFFRKEPQPFIHSGEPDISRYLERRIHRLSGQAVGFKLPLYSMQQHPDIVPALKAFGYKVLLVTRENLLDQFISMRLAQINNAWRSDLGEFKARSFVADPDDAKRRFVQWEQENAETAAAVAGLPAFHVTYEQIKESLPQVFDFLGLPPAETRSPFQRQRTWSRSEAVENFAELAAHFATTRWAGFFEA